IGHTGSRWKLQTPALVIDLDAFEQNLSTMASWARDHGTRLRPHAKTHKSIEIARRQLAAGAIGICVAKLGEAEIFVEAGIGKVLITSPIVTDAKIERVIELNEQADELILV